MQIRDLSPALGAEIDGLDPHGEIDDETWHLLSATFDERGVLVFRGIELDAPMQHRIVERLFASGDVGASEEAASETVLVRVQHRTRRGFAVRSVAVPFRHDVVRPRGPGPVIVCRRGGATVDPDGLRQHDPRVGHVARRPAGPGRGSARAP